MVEKDTESYRFRHISIAVTTQIRERNQTHETDKAGTKGDPP